MIRLLRMVARKVGFKSQTEVTREVLKEDAVREALHAIRRGDRVLAELEAIEHRHR